MKLSKMKINNGLVHELTGNGFDSFIKEGFVLVDFFGEWCMPCLMMTPIIEELADKMKGKIKFGKVNVDENQQLSQKFEVRSIPNLVFFKDGKFVDRFVGSISGEELEEKLSKFLR